MGFAEKIKELRRRKRLTQAQLGEKLGVRKSTVSNWERDLSEPNSQAIRKRVEQMFEGEGITEEEERDDWWEEEKKRREALKGDRIYFASEVKEILEEVKETMEDEEDPRRILKLILLELAFDHPHWITRDPSREAEITLGKRPKEILEKKTEDYYRDQVSFLAGAVWDVFGLPGLDEVPEYHPGLDQIFVRLVKAFPEYLEREETEGKVTIRLK